MDTLDTPDAPCSHPIRRHFCWTARDDTVPSGVVLCIACCDCGQVLAIQSLPKIQVVEVDYALL